MFGRLGHTTTIWSATSWHVATFTDKQNSPSSTRREVLTTDSEPGTSPAPFKPHTKTRPTLRSPIECVRGGSTTRRVRNVPVVLVMTKWRQTRDHRLQYLLRHTSRRRGALPLPVHPASPPGTGEPGPRLVTVMPLPPQFASACGHVSRVCRSACVHTRRPPINPHWHAVTWYDEKLAEAWTRPQLGDPYKFVLNAPTCPQLPPGRPLSCRAARSSHRFSFSGGVPCSSPP
jgi:hypothetical protein